MVRTAKLATRAPAAAATPRKCLRAVLRGRFGSLKYDILPPYEMDGTIERPFRRIHLQPLPT